MKNFGLLLLIGVSNALIAYDCRPKALNVTTLSLLDVAPCDIKEPEVTTKKQRIQLVQMKNYESQDGIMCKVHMNRRITRCGMFSHISDVKHSVVDFILEVSRETCQTLADHGTYKTERGFIIDKIPANIEMITPMVIAGKIDYDGSCSGTTYADPYGTWENVVVQATYKIKYQKINIRVNLNTDKVSLPTGTTCDRASGHCIDAEEGYAYWERMPFSDCEEDSELLFEGVVDKVHDPEGEGTLYTITDKNTAFALTANGITEKFGNKIIATEHPRLYIYELGAYGYIPRGNSRIQKGDAMNLDMFAYATWT